MFYQAEDEHLEDVEGCMCITHQNLKCIVTADIQMWISNVYLEHVMYFSYVQQCCEPTVETINKLVSFPFKGVLRALKGR